MKKLTLLFLLLSGTAMAQFQFLSPLPGSKMLHPKRNIIIREGSILDPSSVKETSFTVRGSKSGDHKFSVVIARDQKTIILNPETAFDFDEEVTVAINAGIATETGKKIRSFSFSFTTHGEYTPEEQENFKKCRSIVQAEEMEKWGTSSDEESSDLRDITGAFTIKVNTSPSPGDIFYNAWSSFYQPSHFAGYHIISTDGDSVFSSETENIFDCDFEVSKRGYLTHRNNDLVRNEVLDSNYNLIDSYYAVNGYTADVHEFEYLADGHALLIADEYQTVDMTVYNPNYNSHATVMGTVIQEFDEEKNLVFEWRSFDHVDILESQHVNLSSSFIDYIHTNSIDIDDDGNIVTSNRHFEQLNKIDRNTGDFIWRLGGVNNQFTFTNDPEKFSYEHDARCHGNGTYTLWDNGNYHAPTHSMAKKYQLDLNNMTATLIWSYQPKKDNGTNAYFYAMGSVQQLPSGNYFMNGGWDSGGQSNYWEVTPSGTVVWELALTSSKSLVSYRARKFVWNPCAPVKPSSIQATSITATTAKIKWSAVSNAVSYDVQYKKINAANFKIKNSTTTSKKLKNLVANKSYVYQVRTHCANGYTSDWSLLDTFKTLPLKLYPEDANVNLAFELSPNPANDFLHVLFDTDEEQEVIISVFDLSGRKVSVVPFQASTSNDDIQMNVSSLVPGIYFIEAKSDDWREVRKFVVQ